MHDPRIGRFFAVDPLASTYPYWSPYAFSGNQVIHKIELEGLEPTLPPPPSTAPALSPAESAMMDAAISEALGEYHVKPSPAQTTSTSGSGVTKVGTGALRSVSLTIFAVLIPQSMGTGDVPLPKIQYHTLEVNGTLYHVTSYQLQRYNEILDSKRKAADWYDITDANQPFPYAEDIKPAEIITDDPSTLSDEYLEGVRERVNKGKGTPNDYKYLDEAYARLKQAKNTDSEGPVDPNRQVTFTQGTGKSQKRVTVTLPDGYELTKHRSHGQKVYRHKKRGDYITPDTDGHNGGVWKGATGVSKLGSKTTRSGTYDQNMNKIGD